MEETKLSEQEEINATLRAIQTAFREEIENASALAKEDLQKIMPEIEAIQRQCTEALSGLFNTPGGGDVEDQSKVCRTG